ncbi:hypothetical protein KUCAC02_013460 [Chaenocephalus aceratus]|uniref:Uncharacterized protein n=1 Tax=Chaenocephalus aceratus TaxID=36190 RepID=A0ACB9WAW5_CHAAC|nr:hypothetical protein KUCAC02_013460 [Chaenocephalus aceratus]
MASTYSSFNLRTTQEKFYIEACDEGSEEVLAVDRVSTEMTLTVKRDVPAGADSRPICGLMGTIRLVAGNYLVVITKRRRQQDFHVQINNVLHTDGFYLPRTTTDAHSAAPGQHQPEFQEMSLLERADQRFVWKRTSAENSLHSQAQATAVHKFVFPVIHGFIDMRSSCINGKVFEWSIISRRSCFRAGVRYYVRGIDSEGHPANYLQGFFCSDQRLHPLFWSQRPNLKYKPKPQISKTVNHLDGFQRHFDSQVILYGKQVILNLINQKGSEKPLELAFDKMVADLGNGMVKYIAFDFHKECSRMRWHRLQILLDMVAEMQDELGYFLVDADGKVLLHQDGTFRSNCMDCLDRTNVIQSMLAQRALQSQLRKMGVLHVGQQIEEQVAFGKMFKNAWADNADACAKQYAGTGALKTDFTRTGKRTHWGLVMDGWNSMIRYYKNNFSDGYRQDSIDLFLGNYAPKDWKFLTLPIVMVVAFSMCIICLLMAGETWTETLAYVLFWGSASKEKLD